MGWGEVFWHRTEADQEPCTGTAGHKRPEPREPAGAGGPRVCLDCLPSQLSSAGCSFLCFPSVFANEITHQQMQNVFPNIAIPLDAVTFQNKHDSRISQVQRLPLPAAFTRCPVRRASPPTTTPTWGSTPSSVRVSTSESILNIYLLGFSFLVPPH